MIMTKREIKKMFAVSCENKGDYIRIIVEGEGTLENSMQIHQEIITLLGDTDKKLALIDISRLVGRLSMADSIRRAEAIPLEIRGKMVRTAMLEDHENMVFAYKEEMAMVNRGIKIKIFFDSEKAIEWLLQDEHARKSHAVETKSR
ncbi:MAG: hypothetical protein A2283_08990 [Lentisphaerae bacterium RIFOXYA12_FULL_48_11]|nr:MAG: hypothetical protein A2283_08990 [Lentisphaerae bacterium RIFOXYA12_FULL_48_11]